MSRNRISPEDKILAVQKYLKGKISQGGIASQFQVSKTSVQQWIFNYQSMGSEIFFQKKEQTVFQRVKGVCCPRISCWKRITGRYLQKVWNPLKR